MTPNFSLYLDPQTTIYKQLFQLDDEPKSLLTVDGWNPAPPGMYETL